MKKFLPDVNVTKLLLDFAHDIMSYYLYCRKQHITPFIELNGKGGRHPVISSLMMMPFPPVNKVFGCAVTVPKQ